MSDVCEKLVMLALSSENVDEAVAALKKARRLQPFGKLAVLDAPDWVDFRRMQEAFQIERDAFEAERRDYQRRLLGKPPRKRPSWKVMKLRISLAAFRARRKAALVAFSLAFIGGTTVGGSAQAPERIQAALAVLGLN